MWNRKKNGIKTENILELIKDLSDNQKERLKQLYIEQIESLNSSTEIYKKKILKIKSSIQTSSKAN